jgi:hypothetical protein
LPTVCPTPSTAPAAMRYARTCIRVWCKKCP